MNTTRRPQSTANAPLVEAASHPNSTIKIELAVGFALVVTLENVPILHIGIQKATRPVERIAFLWIMSQDFRDPGFPVSLAEV